MAHDAQCCCSNDLVEFKAQEGFEPSPEEKVSFVEYHPRDEYWPEEPNNGCTDGAVGDDYGDQSSKDGEYELHGVGTEESVRLCERRGKAPDFAERDMDRVLDFLCRIIANVIDEGAGSSADEAFERKSDTRNCAVVEPYKTVRERDQHEEAYEPCNAESRASLRRCQCLLHTKPGKHDGCESNDHMQSQPVDGRRHCCRQIITTVFDQNQKVHFFSSDSSVVKCPLRSGTRLLRCDRIEVLLVSIAQHEQ